MYIFTLPSTIDGMTHIGVQEEVRTDDRIYVSGEYGKLVAGTFTPATRMIAHAVNITDDYLVDLDEQSKAAGRPSDKPRHSIDSTDIVSWLEEDPAVIQARIDARQA